jgi:Flp pilus assembly protein TadG
MKLSNHNQAFGVAAVEFALIAAVFFTILLGALEMGRILFTWNTAAEATRWGARIATVCDFDNAQIKARMVQLLPNLLTDEASIVVTYLPDSCTVDGAAGTVPCQTVTVSLALADPVQTFIPLVATNLLLPSFTTTLTRESLQSTWPGATGGANPVCM